MDPVRDRRAVAAWQRENLGSAKLDVEHLRDFQRELRALATDGTWTRQLRAGNKEVAEAVVDAATGIAGGLSALHRKAATSLKAMGEQRNASVRLGSRTAPFALGAEFGAIRYAQFPPWRGNQWSFRGLDFSDHTTGYFLHPAIRALIVNGEIQRRYGEMIERIASAAFPD